MNTYKIIRMYQDLAKTTEIIATGLTLQEAQDWCHDPETSSRTATSPEALNRTREYGEWFDGWTEEN
jgi:hypothetical protein